MKRKALTKDFDRSDVQDLRLDFDAMWSDEAWAEFGERGDVHPEIARAIDVLGPSRVLDITCGSGSLARSLQAPWFGVDLSMEQLKQAPPRTAIADARALPFADETFDAAASLYNLYFFEEPSAVADEAWRVLKPGGAFVVCAPGRDDSPEIHGFGPRDDAEAFASEDIEELLGERFTDIEMHPWNFPYLELKNEDMATDYIRFFYFPALSLDEAREIARGLTLPLKITKTGAWGLARKPN
jgi:ubiquinone/menaquinone biosynthesis C-methylase UbiE